MNFDELKKTWEKEMNTKSPQMENSIQIAQKTDREMKGVLAIETSVCALLFIVSVAALASGFAANPMMIFSLYLMMAVSIYIPYRLLKARRAEQLDNWTLRTNIDREIEKLEKQSRLLSGVAGWYLAPLAVVVFTGSWGGYAQRTGTYVPDSGLLIYWAGCIALGVLVIVLNKNAVNKKLAPTLERLKNLKKQLDD